MSSEGRKTTCALCGRIEPLRDLADGRQVCADSEACVQAVVESAKPGRETARSTRGDMHLDYNGRPTYTERKVVTAQADLVLRQVGWIGQTKRVYTLDERPQDTEPGGFFPLWIVAHEDQPVIEVGK